MKWIQDTRGSMTIEAALVVPFVALAAMAFVGCMQLLMTEMAMQQAVSNTVNIVSAHMYPVALAQQSAPGQQAGQVISQASAWVSHIDQAAALLQAYEEHLPSGLADGITGTLSWLKQTGADTVDAGLGMVFLPLLQSQLSSAWVEPSAVHITDVHFPDLGDRSKAYFGISASYTVKLALPFYQTEIEIEVDAYERVWVAG